MRILFLAKRQYTGKDLLDDRYGRLYEIPSELARLGHQVTGVCLSYRFRQEGHIAGPEIDSTLVNWYSVNIGRLILPGFLLYVDNILKIIGQFKPDIIVACSDAIHVLVGVLLAKKKVIPCVVDLYDNFESFGATKIPGGISCFRWAVKQASGVVCISDLLKEFITKEYNVGCSVETIENGISRELFHPRARLFCRQQMGFPADAKIIGTAGSIGQSRGVDVLFKAFGELAARDSSIHLALAGPVENGTKLPDSQQIHYLGKLSYEQVPLFLGSLDVGIICNLNSSFGRYCFPQKAYEMIACGIPVVVSKIGAMKSLFSEYPECLYVPEDYKSLTSAVLAQLNNVTIQRLTALTWQELAVKYQSLLTKVCKETI